MAQKNRLADRGARRPSLIACLHLQPLPGSPKWGYSMESILDRALAEAEAFAAAKVDGMILENTHDVPYLKRPIEAATVAAMARVATEVRRRFDLPLGIQVLAGANLAALDIAASCDLDFIRVEGFAFAHVADEGIIESDAGVLLRRRAHLGVGQIEVWADIKKKHSSHAITGDMSIRETAEGALFYDADGVIVTGGATGLPAAVGDLESIADLNIRKVIGSGIDRENIEVQGRLADVLIVGSSIKDGGDWRGEVDARRVGELVRILDSM